MTNAAQKTPISLLQELCAQQGMTPDYKLMSVEGAVHAPTFMYRVQVNEVVATATGQSKKKAKHAAAKSVLEKLLGKDGEFSEGFQSDGVTVNAETLNEIVAEPAIAPPPEENAEDNPVGKLQEHCMKNRWQPPYYETENATGLPHEKIFTIVCFVGDFTTTGEGKSKRLAKRQAAAKMLERLNSMKEVSDKESEMAKDNSMNEDEAVAKNSSIVDDKEGSESENDDIHEQSNNGDKHGDINVQSDNDDKHDDILVQSNSSDKHDNVQSENDDKHDDTLVQSNSSDKHDDNVQSNNGDKHDDVLAQSKSNDKHDDILVQSENRTSQECDFSEADKLYTLF